LGLKKLEGINGSESVFHTIRCTYQELWGDLVLTSKGIVFLEIKGMLGKNRERLHQFEYDEVRSIRTKRKRTGIFTHGVVVEKHSEDSDESESESFFYSCEEYKAVLFAASFEKSKLQLRTTDETTSTIQSLSTFKRNADLLKVAKNSRMRPYFFAFTLGKLEAEVLSLLDHKSDIDLNEVAKNKQIHSLVSLLHESDPRKVHKEEVYRTVVDYATHLSNLGKLDGIVTELGRFVSNRALDRVTVPYESILDFETIFAQLHERGLLVWALECPGCFRKIKYPKTGKEAACQFCDATIYAKDVLEKFKDLL
jgi:hypothetical protein